MVTVIVPAYNCEDYLRDAVESALAQTYADLEILIVEDCSTDATLMLARSLAEKDSRIHVHANSHNMGVAQTRNYGMKLAKGEYIAFLDADDVWLPDKLEKQISLFKNTNADLCYTAYSFIDGAGNPVRRPYHVPEKLCWKHLIRENVIGCSTALFRREATDSIFMRGEYAHEDYVFWLELLQKGCVACGVDQPLMKYRVLQSSRSYNKLNAAKNRWQIYRRFLKMSRIKAGAAFLCYAAKSVRKHLL